eukprot:CAMPEP_0179328374 /NCGR_PEP_ID=MMETSP0797-20121207/62484_1 /TAXON_ID=47934 /ORGANISM="Dinophysis acuminata, Strain DAEP01" /LENGTH=53 /DNA_ID=CAMNT_0021040807 /DNA_START=82 /DNA_END=239 /DNA_ORIENTATION=+
MKEGCFRVKHRHLIFADLAIVVPILHPEELPAHMPDEDDAVPVDARAAVRNWS